ncbi:MAG TPA: Uma2 family endonuclease [Bryobacteraceae bacterium]|jgi:Uma2 family endonuclease|nr:Uma2 family endonuclease [Bryobacteraceae bacterium]
MSTVLVSLEEYLDTAYSPDREYVDGVVVERHVGERPHSRGQGNTLVYVQTRYPHIFTWPEQRVRTIPGRRSRVPDVCVTLEDPGTDVFEAPPFIAIEILSKRDEMSDVLEKLAEYQDFGVPHIWLIDPRRKKAFTYGLGRLEEVRTAALIAGEIRLPLEEVFRGL